MTKIERDKYDLMKLTVIWRQYAGATDKNVLDVQAKHCIIL